MLKDNNIPVKKHCSLLKAKLSLLFNHTKINPQRHASSIYRRPVTPMVYLMNQTLRNEYQSILIHKRSVKPLPMLENSMTINPLRLYTNNATLTSNSKERNNQFVFKWSRNRPIALNGMSTGSTLMSINNYKTNTKSNNKSCKSNEMSIGKDNEHYMRIKTHLNGIKKIEKKKRNNATLFRNSFIEEKRKNYNENKDDMRVDLVKTENDNDDVSLNTPKDLVHMINLYIHNIEKKMIQEMNPNENMVKKYKQLRNDIRVTNDHVKDILGSLIRKQRDNDEFLEKKKYLNKKNMYKYK